MTGDAPANVLPWHRRLLYGLTNWGLFAAGAINLAVGTWSAVTANTAIAATSLTAGLILLFAATIDRFESLKGLGIEAKTRQLDQKIEQADMALRRLKELAELTGATLVDMSSRMGRIGTAPSPREAYALAQRVRSIMEALGSERPALREALGPWLRITCHDLAIAITAPVSAALSEKLQQLDRERAAIPQPMDPNNPILLRTTSTSREVSSFLEQKMRRIHKFELEDYPDRFLQLLEEVPLIDRQLLAPVQEKARQFAPMMRELRENLALTNPEPWFSEIDDHRNNH